MLQFAAGCHLDHAVYVHIFRAEKQMRVADFQAHSTFLARIKLEDTAKVENQICRARIGRNRRGSRRRCPGQRLRIAVKAGSCLSKEPEVISPDSSFHSGQALENRAAIMRSGSARVSWEIQQVGVGVEHAVEAVGKIAAEAWFGTHIGNTFARNDQRAEQRPKFPAAGYLGFVLVFDQGANAVANAETQAGGVVDLSGQNGGAAAR